MGQTGSSSSEALVAQRYHLQKVKLGRGNFGTVWRAVDRQSGSVVAIKQMSKEGTSRRGFDLVSRDIAREIAMMKACQHENLLNLIDTFEDSSDTFLAVEYCDGGDFEDKIKELGLGPPEKEVAEWMRQVCSAIAALHSKGICHRDIKPDNFLLADAGHTLKLSDFGLAIFAPGDTLLTEKCGTPLFMSPEVHKLPDNSPGYWLPVDVWAAGVLMFMLMLGGKQPFIDMWGRLDLQRLCEGALEFTSSTSMMGSVLPFAAPFDSESKTTRFTPSEMAQRLCRRMVEPNPRHRLSAVDALQDPWLYQGRTKSSPMLGSRSNTSDARAPGFDKWQLAPPTRPRRHTAPVACNPVSPLPPGGKRGAEFDARVRRAGVQQYPAAGTEMPLDWPKAEYQLDGLQNLGNSLDNPACPQRPEEPDSGTDCDTCVPDSLSPDGVCRLVDTSARQCGGNDTGDHPCACWMPVSRRTRPRGPMEALMFI